MIQGTPPDGDPDWQAWFDRVRARLNDPRQSAVDPTSDARHAAVAIVLRPSPSPDVLFMERAHREGDRWSGHVSFPGGHHESQDELLLHTAQRETMEEVGLDLASTARPLGHLPRMQALSHGHKIPLWVTPFVFVQHQDADLELGPEASNAFRVPLAPLWRGELADEKEVSVKSVVKRYPAWRHGEWLVWGMTYHIMTSLLEELKAVGDLPS